MTATTGVWATRHGGDHRGGAPKRRADKNYLLNPVSGFGGNGVTVPCIHGCGTLLTFTTLQRDRKIPGGPYARWNLQPSCGSCNRQRSDNADWRLPE